jgi:pimeloyl-ACP methyl ester carboxylesterase
MLDLLDLILLKRGIPADDQTLVFRRIDGNPQSRVIYFLPWHTPYRFARHFGFMPLDFLAAYEMPPAIVSSEPARSVQAALGLLADAESTLLGHGIDPKDALIIGLSVGAYTATLLANRHGARLCAVTGADRADLMVWESPAARLIKRRALQKGYALSHYTEAMRGLNPAENLAHIANGSIFVLGTRDPFVPAKRSAAWISAIERFQPSATLIKVDAGHVRTLAMCKAAQQEFAGARPAARWRAGRPASVDRNPVGSSPAPAVAALDDLAPGSGMPASTGCVAPAPAILWRRPHLSHTAAAATDRGGFVGLWETSQPIRKPGKYSSVGERTTSQSIAAVAERVTMGRRGPRMALLPG